MIFQFVDHHNGSSLQIYRLTEQKKYANKTISNMILFEKNKQTAIN